MARAVNSPFHMHHWLPVQDLDWVVVILCNNFPPQPQIWPQWTHYPLIHNFHPLVPSALAAHGPANTRPDANLGCLGFMNIWKLRLGWSLIGTKSLSFNLLSLYSCLLGLGVIQEIMCIWKIGHHSEIGGAGAGPCQQIGICDGSLVIAGWGQDLTHFDIEKNYNISSVCQSSKSCVNYPNYLEIIPPNISDTSSNCFPIVSQCGLRIPAWIP